jgi:hypothetical protein
MPSGPRGERRPADVIGNAVKVMRIATGRNRKTPDPMTTVKILPPRRLGRKAARRFISNRDIAGSAA